MLKPFLDIASFMKNLKEQLGEIAIENWFKDLEIEQNENNITFFFNNKFIQDWVQNNYIDNVHQALDKTIDQTYYLNLDLKRNKKKQKENVIKNEAIYEQNAMQANSIKPVQNQTYTFDNFIIGKTNEMAYTAALKVSQHIRNAQFNPLFIYGEPGVGKSHLLSAIVNYVNQHNPDIKIYYMTAEEFMYTFIKALKDNGMVGFKEELRDANLLLIDDVQFMMGKQSTQDEFFHTFNFLKSNSCQIVFSSDKSPTQLDKLEDRLRSRIGGGLTIEIHQPDYELRLSILMSKAKDMQIDKNVIEFVAEHTKGNVRNLEGAWIKLITHSQWMGKTLTTELAQIILADILEVKEEKIISNNRSENLLDFLLTCVCKYYSVSMREILSDKRNKHITKARHVAMFLIKDAIGCSASEIGRIFNGKDHSSVIYALDKITKDMEVNSNLKYDIEQIKHQLLEDR